MEAVLADPVFYFSGTNVTCLHLRASVITGSDVKLRGNFYFVPDKVKYTISNFNTLFFIELDTLPSMLPSTKFCVLLLFGRISDICELPSCV